MKVVCCFVDVVWIFVTDEILPPLEGISIFNESKGENETVNFKLATVEQDQGSVPHSTEHFGASGKINCQRCLNSSVPNEGGKGFYQTGYISGKAYDGK